MGVFRVEKNKNFTVMSNYHLKEKNLSLKAKGLLSLMLSLPDDWDYSMSGLAKICKESITAIKSTLQDLKKYHYLKIHKSKDQNGRFEYEYVIYEKPYMENPPMEIPPLDVPPLDVPPVENHTQLNTKELRTNNKDKLDKINSITRELINRNFLLETDLELYRYNDLFDELLKEHDYKTVIRVAHYVVTKIDKEGITIKNKFSYLKTSIINNLNKIASNNLPSWFNQDIKAEVCSDEELAEIEQLLSQFK